MGDGGGGEDDDASVRDLGRRSMVLGGGGDW